ncbi:MAG: hypothetical protein KDK99_13365, partial [Verrucomicrobiales bacterium]|nr:hypothetical protein [Verrucomicrobiales bacterium]
MKRVPVALVPLVVVGLGITALVLAVDAGWDQWNGVAEVWSRVRGVIQVRADEDPVAFRNLMIFQWVRVAMALGAGMAVNSLRRWGERLDPLRPD